MKETNDARYIFNTNPAYTNIQKGFIQQINKGVEKYGTDVNKDNYTLTEWQQHVREETIDLLTYNEMNALKMEQIKVKLNIIKQNDMNPLTQRLLKQIFELIG